MDKRKYSRLLGIGLCVLILSACHMQPLQEREGEAPSQSIDLGISIWLVDWLADKSLIEVSKASKGIDQLLLFGIYFDEAGQLYEVDQKRELIKRVLAEDAFQEKEIYVTIVNDQFRADGTIIQKSPELLDMLLATPDSRQAHIEDIVEYAKAYHIDGIEIDYERIPIHLVKNYISFIQELKLALEKENLALRIVLEPSFPSDKFPLPEELSYVVMAYNLYGFHSGPGPKANYDFLDQLSTTFPNDAGNISIALATGGFAWKNDQAKQLSNEQIEEILQNQSIEPIRDPSSGALTFIYKENGEDVEVWFADAKTIVSWCDHLREHGYTQFSIWRAGGLTEDFLYAIKNIKGDTIND